MSEIFFNPYGRLRSGWRLTLFLLLLILPFALVGVLVGLVAYHTRKHQREQNALAARHT